MTFTLHDLRRFLAKRAAADARERAAERRRARARAKTLARGATWRGPRARIWRSAGSGRAGRASDTPAVLMKVHRGGLAADHYSAAKGELIDTNLPADASARMAAWQRDQSQHPRVSRLFQHLSFSRPAGQPLADLQWRQFIRAQLHAAGFDGCKFAAWRHSDTDHDHVHVLVSRHRPDGSLVSDSNNFRRWREATRLAEREAGIPTPLPKNAPPTSRPASDRAVSAERRARRRGKPSAWLDPARVREALVRSNTPQQLQQELARRGIELRVTRSAAGAAAGLQLRSAGAEEWLAASSIARDLSLPRVQAQLEANGRQAAQAPLPPVRRQQQTSYQHPQERE